MAPKTAGVPTELEEHTAQLRVADRITPDPDAEGVPVNRNRPSRRDESGAFTRAALEHVDKAVRRQLGHGLPDEIKELTATILSEKIAEWVTDEPSSARTRTQPQYRPPQSIGLHRWAFGIATVTAIALMLTIVAASVVAMQMLNRLGDIDKAQAVLAARVAETESRQLELRSDILSKQKAADETLAAHTRQIEQIQTRQDALVIYALEGMDRLLRERKIDPPDIPPILQIAKAEIMLRYGRNEQKR